MSHDSSSVQLQSSSELDGYLAPLSDDLARDSLEQPLLFVNSALDFQGPTSVKMILTLVKPANEHGTVT